MGESVRIPERATFCRITVYESKSRFYLVGSDVSETKFSVLKIDRSEGARLVISDGGNEYSKGELNELLSMINDANSTKKPEKSGKSKGNLGGLSERCFKAFGLIGFVRFLEGYYMLVVSKASQVGQLGYDQIYTIEDVMMLYIPSVPSNNSDEQKYLRMFQTVDLCSNFYFSYTYDLSRTLQANVAKQETDVEEKFVWNSFLMEPLLAQGASSSWLLPLTHGFYKQVTVSLPGTSLGIMLIARRSNKQAGTRFLKRGANNAGFVSNEVETEQIIWEWDTSPDFLRGRWSSFVQHRGSIPLFWSQDPAKRPPVVMGKPPPIQLDLPDPYAQLSALHFSDLRQKYGDPVVAINLCKRRERRPHESLLNDEYCNSISYLNQFLHPDENILYLSFDMARCNKAGNVLPKLEEIAYNVIRLQGWFQSFPPLHFMQVRKSPLMDGVKQTVGPEGDRLLQSGVTRTNCIDCLDRTNVAQFVIGKVALAYQLYSMGLLDEPVLPLQTEVSRLLESLYEEHGDTLALQYAGSHLVHSVKTYKKTALFQERSRDVIQTLSRYYSNTFADNDKQNGLNLFLGVFRPNQNGSTALWDFLTDFYLHNPPLRPPLDYCAWFEALPFRKLTVFGNQLPSNSPSEIDAIDMHYRTFEMSSMDALIAKASQFRNVNLNKLKSEAAAVSGVLQLWKRQSDATPVPAQKGKESGNRGSGGGDESSDEEGGTAGSDTEVIYAGQWKVKEVEEEFLDVSLVKKAPRTTSTAIRKALPSMQEAYGVSLHPPSRADMIKYQNYANLGGQRPDDEDLEILKKLRWERWDEYNQQPSLNWAKMKPISFFTNDSSFGVEMPIVSNAALEKYREAVRCAEKGPSAPKKNQAAIYKGYVQWQKRSGQI